MGIGGNAGVNGRMTSKSENRWECGRWNTVRGTCDKRDMLVSKISKMKPFPELRFQVLLLIVSGNKVAP